MSSPPPNPNAADPQPPLFPLHCAAHQGDLERIRSLLGAGARVDQPLADALGPHRALRGGKGQPKKVAAVPPAGGGSSQLPLHRFAGRTPLAMAVEVRRPPHRRCGPADMVGRQAGHAEAAAMLLAVPPPLSPAAASRLLPAGRGRSDEGRRRRHDAAEPGA